jgi:hypothetical protein
MIPNRPFIVVFVGLTAMSLGCGRSPQAPTSPSPNPVTATTPTIDFIAPAAGLGGDPVTVVGSGFVPGAILSLDGMRAIVTGANATRITANIPGHAAGNADVVVTNPGGQSATLRGGYTYQVATLTSSSSHVTSGDQLSVSWVTQGGRPWGDWIALMRVGNPSQNYESGWWQYTSGLASGSFTLSAPTQPGEYEFRYLPDDGFIEAVRSNPITVAAAGSQ